MVEEKTSTSFAEEINQHQENNLNGGVNQFNGFYRKSMSKKRKKRISWTKKTKVILTSFLILLVFTTLFSGWKAFREVPVIKNTAYRQYEAVLSDAEMKEWETKEADKGETFVQLNTKIPVQGVIANIRLINPPYNNYSCQFKLSYKETPGEYVYESKQIIPGTVVEYVKLNEAVSPGEHDAIVKYTFFNSKGEIQGSHSVNVVLESY